MKKPRASPKTLGFSKKASWILVEIFFISYFFEVCGSVLALQDASQVVAVGGFAKALDGLFECGLVEVSHLKSDLLETGDAQALAVLDDPDKLGGFEQRVMGAGIEPGGAAAEFFDLEAVGL